MERRALITKLVYSLVVTGLIVVGNIAGMTQAFGQVPGVTENSIKIGLFAPFTGPIALYGKASHLCEAIYEKANEEGGIHGRKLVMVSEDDACDPIKGVAAVKKLIYQDKVFMLHGGMCSNVCLAVKKEILETGIPYMDLGAASHLITTPLEKNIFTGVFTSVIASKSMADFAMSKPGVKRVGIIKHTDEWGKSFYEPLLEHLKEKYNVTPIVDTTIERGVADATPQILEIKKANPDVLIAITYVDATSTLLRDSYKLGLRVPIVANPGVAVDEQFKRVGIPDALKAFFAPFWFKYPLDSPDMDKWKELLKKRYPKDEFDMFAGIGIAGALVTIEALKVAGRDLTREKFVKALESLNNFSPKDYPMATPIRFSSTNHVGIVNLAFSVMDVSAKRLKVLYNLKE
jgi:branched-chain amino acid transport system substrate-binding protein